MNHSDIIGEWKITRSIEDRLNQKKFALDGVAIFTDNNSNDFLNIQVPVHYDITFVGSSATLYLVTGFVTSATAPSFSDAAA